MVEVDSAFENFTFDNTTLYWTAHSSQAMVVRTVTSLHRYSHPLDNEEQSNVEFEIKPTPNNSIFLWQIRLEWFLTSRTSRSLLDDFESPQNPRESFASILNESYTFYRLSHLVQFWNSKYQIWHASFFRNDWCRKVGQGPRQSYSGLAGVLKNYRNYCTIYECKTTMFILFCWWCIQQN